MIDVNLIAQWLGPLSMLTASLLAVRAAEFQEDCLVKHNSKQGKPSNQNKEKTNEKINQDRERISR